MPHRPLPIERFPDPLASGRGLTAPEAAVRRTRYDANDIVAPAAGAWRSLLANTAQDPMLWFLLGTSARYAAIGDRMEAGLLAAAVLPIAAMDAYLHHRTSASTAGLQSRLAARARVWRDGALVVAALSLLTNRSTARRSVAAPRRSLPLA